ncbi:DUF397 domain-containing protein [Actinoallomurus sp. NPDC052274]
METLDGWRKSSRSGAQQGNCVEVKRLDEEQRA